jgi:hypothetical protein
MNRRDLLALGSASLLGGPAFASSSEATFIVFIWARSAVFFFFSSACFDTSR